VFDNGVRYWKNGKVFTNCIQEWLNHYSGGTLEGEALSEHWEDHWSYLARTGWMQQTTGKNLLRGYEVGAPTTYGSFGPRESFTFSAVHLSELHQHRRWWEPLTFDTLGVLLVALLLFLLLLSTYYVRCLFALARPHSWAEHTQSSGGDLHLLGALLALCLCEFCTCWFVSFAR